MTTPTLPVEKTVSAIPLGLLICSSMGLFFLLVSWAAGGQSFFEGLYGYYTLGTLVAGLVAGLAGTAMSGCVMVADPAPTQRSNA